MKSYEIYRCRRNALRLTRTQLAEELECDVQYIIDFECGKRIPSELYIKLKRHIRNKLSELSPIEHYRTKILELAIELRDESDKEIALNEIGHMMIELGRLQGELLGYSSDGKPKEEWV